MREIGAAGRSGRQEALRDVALAIVATALATGVAAAMQRWLPHVGVGFVFMVAVVGVAARKRPVGALLAALLGFGSYNFFFTEPHYSLRMDRSEEVVAVFAFLAAALACSQLAGRVRTQMVAVQAAHAHTAALQSLGERLLAAVDREQVLDAGTTALEEALGCRALVIPAGAVPPPATPDEDERGTRWVLPMSVDARDLGTVVLRFAAAAPGERRALAEAMVRQVALAADRARLAGELAAAVVEGETERLRSALLSSVSHDLRSPLASVIGAASSLAAYGDGMAAVDRGQLLDAITSEGERLDRYIQNLLDMTRLGSGELTLRREWVTVEELLGAAVGRLAKQLPASVVLTELEADLPLLHVHPALVEQALFNVLENAARFSPAGAPVVVRARREREAVAVEVIDRGPGIPAAERERVFERFHSAERPDSGRRGSGLGLAIVRGMIGAHGGTVAALAGHGGAGTTLRLTLPVREQPQQLFVEEDGE